VPCCLACRCLAAGCCAPSDVVAHSASDKREEGCPCASADHIAPQPCPACSCPCCACCLKSWQVPGEHGAQGAADAGACTCGYAQKHVRMPLKPSLSLGPWSHHAGMHVREGPWEPLGVGDAWHRPMRVAHSATPLLLLTPVCAPCCAFSRSLANNSLTGPIPEAYFAMSGLTSL